MTRGVQQLWLGQRFDYDAISLAAVIGTRSRISRVGTSVVPINPRRPLIVAAAAQTAQAATHGKFSLGLGLGVPFLEGSVFGLTTRDTVQRLREYLTVLRAIRDERPVNFHSSQLAADGLVGGAMALARATPFPLYVAAIEPRALQVAGELADGNLPAYTGPRTIEGFIAPTIAQAAADAGGHVRASSRWSVSLSPTMSTRRVRATATSLALYDCDPVLTRRCLRAKICRGG